MYVLLQHVRDADICVVVQVLPIQRYQSRTPVASSKLEAERRTTFIRDLRSNAKKGIPGGMPFFILVINGSARNECGAWCPVFGTRVNCAGQGEERHTARCTCPTLLNRYLQAIRVPVTLDC